MNKQSFCSDFSSDQIESYDELLNACHGSVQVAGLTFDPSDVIFNCDPIAYRCGLSDYIDSIEDEEE